jgi:electron transfer flavoprotein alpha subunit
MPRCVAVVVVRDAVLPLGGTEAICEADRVVILIGSGTEAAATTLATIAADVTCIETSTSTPAALAAELVRVIDHERVVLPASPDGRDLAPRLAALLDRPLLAGAVEVRADRVLLARRGGLSLDDVSVDGPVVITLQPGVRGVDTDPTAELVVRRVEAHAGSSMPDVEVLDVLPPDAATIDLAESPRILGGGAGLDGADRFAQLGRVAHTLGASMGATRVITDRGWIEHTRQIGTTGVVVDPELYIAFGISGAVQHTSGLGHPDHIISVNTDPHCPMMSMADLAIVADANAVIDALASRVETDQLASAPTDGCPA